MKNNTTNSKRNLAGATEQYQGLTETEKAYVFIKKIWKGAKWGNFKRYWLGRRRTKK
jgi:hypothetical protein